MSYHRINWENYPSPSTPINATNLNIMDKGIKDLDDAMDADATALANEVITRASLTAHNLLPNTAKTTSVNGVTFTVNADGTVTVSTGSGGATANTNLAVNQTLTEQIVPKGSYIMSSGVTGSNAYLLASAYNGSTWVKNFEDTQSGDLNMDIDYVGYDTIRVYLTVKRGAVYTTSATVKPMIRLASDSDSTYQPYAKSNKELTGNVTDIETAIAPIEIGTASQAYAKGDYLIMNDKLYKANTAIVSGATLTVGTNIVQTSVAKELEALDVGTYDICGVMSSAYNSYIRCPIPYKRGNTKHTVTLNSVKRLADATDYTSNFSVDSSQTGYFTIYSSSTALATQAMIFNITVS